MALVRQRRMKIGTQHGIAFSWLISSAPVCRSIQSQGEAAAAHRWPPRIPGTAATDPGGGATDSGLDAAQPYVPWGRRGATHGRRNRFRPLWHHPRRESYCMDAAATSLGLHERGNHAV
jgi:hypothetical protein